MKSEEENTAQKKRRLRVRRQSASPRTLSFAVYSIRRPSPTVTWRNLRAARNFITSDSVSGEAKAPKAKPFE